MGQRTWTPEEEARLREVYSEKANRELAPIFGRTAKALSSRAKILRLKKAVGHGGHFTWTTAMEQAIRDLYPETLTRTLAAQLGVSVVAAHQRAQKLGVRKSATYIEHQHQEEGRRLLVSGAAHRFPKGHQSFNKGKRMPGWAPGRMAETQFKKGQRSGIAAKNWCPIGTVRADGEGFLRIKVREGVRGEPYGFGNVKIWPLLNRHVWERCNGSIPAGYIVMFKDRDRSNCAIENLELISLADNMRRNTVHNLPPELVQVIQLTGALKRKIRNREEKLNGKEHAAGSSQPSVRNTGIAG